MSLQTKAQEKLAGIWGPLQTKRLLHLAGVPLIVPKTADETVNNSTTLQNDDELFLPLRANEVWWVEAHLFNNSAADADLKWHWTGPSGATFQWGQGSATDLSLVIANNLASGSLGADTITRLEGIVICSSTAGNLQLQWAQNTQQGSDTKVLANSHIIATRLA